MKIFLTAVLVVGMVMLLAFAFARAIDIEFALAPQAVLTTTL